MNWWKLLNFLGDVLKDESKHFLLGFLGGLLAWGLTWIVLSATAWVLRRLTHREIYMAAGYGTLTLSLLLCFAFALIGHAWLDGFTVWYTTPLGPPLELVIP